MSYLDKNKAAWKRLSRTTRIATNDELQNPLRILDPRGWLPESVEGLKVLCLASGGGRQSILYASVGAEVTVVDLSPAMLHLDQREARKRGLNVKTVQASMESLPMFETESFDVVHQPVSTCYVPDIERVYAEVARVIRDDGIYISQHKQPTSLQTHRPDDRGEYKLGVEYYHDGPLPENTGAMYREKGATEYLHRWEHLIGGLCRTGFWLEDLREPFWANNTVPVGHKGHRCRFTAPYVRLKARRRPRSTGGSRTAIIRPASAE